MNRAWRRSQRARPTGMPAEALAELRGVRAAVAQALALDPVIALVNKARAGAVPTTVDLMILDELAPILRIASDLRDELAWLEDAELREAISLLLPHTGGG